MKTVMNLHGGGSLVSYVTYSNIFRSCSILVYSCDLPNSRLGWISLKRRKIVCEYHWIWPKLQLDDRYPKFDRFLCSSTNNRQQLFCAKHSYLGNRLSQASHLDHTDNKSFATVNFSSTRTIETTCSTIINIEWFSVNFVTTINSKYQFQ